MLKNLLFKNQDKKQLIIAMVGAFLGITFLITSIHYLIRINDFGKGADILGPNTIIVQKRVSNSSLLKLTRTDFSTSELEKIKLKPFIQDVKPVIANNFNVSFETADPLIPRFRSDVFIQTVDPKFMDVKSTAWKWNEGDQFVPIIMPRDFLVMLNTFMSASGIPQISDNLAMAIKFKFTLSNEKNTQKEWFDTRIIGFTNEIASLLVPENFMSYGNTKFSNGKEQKITQIMISGKEGEFGLVEDLLTKRGLSSKNAQMVVGKLKSIIGTLLMLILGISTIAVFVSGLVLIQYMQLLISRNIYEIKTLIHIGYHPKNILFKFFFYFASIFGLIASLGVAFFFFIKHYIDGILDTGGIHIDKGITPGSLLALLIAYTRFISINYFTAKKNVHKLS